MDELLKNCYGRLFKVGEKGRTQGDIGRIALLKNDDQERYSKLQECELRNSAHDGFLRR